MVGIYFSVHGDKKPKQERKETEVLNLYPINMLHQMP